MTSFNTLFFVLITLVTASLTAQSPTFGPEDIVLPNGSTTFVNSSFDVSHDGKLILSGLSSDKVQVRDVTSGRIVRVLPVDETILQTFFGPEDETVLITKFNGPPMRIDLVSGDTLNEYGDGLHRLTKAIFFDGGRSVLTYGRKRGAAIFNTVSGALVQEFAGGPKGVTQPIFNKAETLLLAVMNEDSLGLWEVPSGKLIQSFAGHDRRVENVRFTTDEKQVLSGSLDGTIRMWDVATGALIRTFAGHNSHVNGIDVHPDGALMVSSGRDSSAIVWELQTGKILHRFNTRKDRWVSGSRFVGQRQLLFVARGDADGTLELWNLPDRFFEPSSSSMATDTTPTAFPDLQVRYQQTDHGNRAVIVREAEGFLFNKTADRVQKFDLQSGELLLCTERTSANVSWVSWDAKGDNLRIVTLDQEYLTLNMTDGKLRSRIHHTPGLSNRSIGISYTPDDTYYVIRAGDTLNVYDRNDALAGQLKGADRQIVGGKISPKGDLLIARGRNGELKLWRLAPPFELLMDIRLPKATSYALVDDKSQYLAVFQNGGEIRVYSLKDFSEIYRGGGGKLVIGRSAGFIDNGRQLCFPTKSEVRCLDFARKEIVASYPGRGQRIYANPDRIVTKIDSTLIVYRPDGKPTVEMPLPSPKPNAKMSPDGRKAIIQQYGLDPILVDFPSGAHLATLRAWGGRVKVLQYHPSGKYIAGVQRDKSISFWRASDGKHLLKYIPVAKDDWVVLHPDGRFDGSPGGLKMIYYTKDMKTALLSEFPERREVGLLHKVMNDL